VIQLQFVAERSVGSATIAWFSSGYLSHVDAVIDDVALTALGSRLPINAAPGWLLGSRGDRRPRSGVQVRRPDYAAFSRRLLVTVPATPEQRARFWQFQRAQLGKPYDRLAILGFLLDRRWRDDDAWFCSELQARALEVNRVFAQRLYLGASKITPVALALVISALPGVTFNET